MALAADAEATLPVLIEEVKRLITSDRRRVIGARGTKLAEASGGGWNEIVSARLTGGWIPDQHGPNRSRVVGPKSRTRIGR